MMMIPRFTRHTSRRLVTWATACTPLSVRPERDQDTFLGFPKLSLLIAPARYRASSNSASIVLAPLFLCNRTPKPSEKNGYPSQPTKTCVHRTNPTHGHLVGKGINRGSCCSSRKNRHDGRIHDIWAISGVRDLMLFPVLACTWCCWSIQCVIPVERNRWRW